jgi:hypothetical protein
MRGEQITTTKDGAESSDNEKDDYFTPAYMVFYAKRSEYPNQILKN